MMLKRNTFVGCFARLVRRPPGRSRASLLLLLFLLALFGFVHKSNAQALPTAEKNGVLDVFGAVSITNTDYKLGVFGTSKSASAPEDAGFTAGAALGLKKFFWGQPAIEARYNYVTGAVANETFVGGGGELRYRYHLFRPYGLVLGGVGSLSVPQTCYKDTGNTLLVGAGTDYPLSPRFAVKAEFTYSFVDITGFNNTSAGAQHLNPWSINLGVVYHIK